jgi:hypothetical protein
MAPRFAPIAPVELLFSHAMPTAPSEPHARPGAHLRVSSPPRLGLPVMPFLVRKAVVSLEDLPVRQGQAVFIDSRNTIVTPPFTLSADNPVTAHLVRGPGERAIWAEAIVDPHGDRSVRCSAWGTNVQGLEFYGARDRLRLAFSGPNIVQLDLSGDGSVVDVVWLTERDTARVKYTEWDVLNLPHQGGPRYLSVPDAIGRANLRVESQTPERAPLQEAGGTPPPTSAPGWNPSVEHDRVGSLAVTVADDLTSLIVDTGRPQSEQTATGVVSGIGGSNPASLTVHRLMRVLAGTIDPGTATYLGFKAYDPVEQVQDGSLILYRVDGVFRTPAVPGPDELADPDTAAFHTLIAGLAPGSALPDAAAVADLLVDSGYKPVDRNFGNDAVAPGLGYRWLGSVAVADLGAPLLPPPPPDVLSATHQAWIAGDDPTAADRHVEIAISGVLTAASLAAVRKASSGAAGDTMNRKTPEGFHVPLTLGQGVNGPLDVPEPGVGHLSDHAAPAGQVDYALAQQDRFGRWSDWDVGTAPPGPRPTPPRPVFTLAFDPQPATVHVSVNVPPPESLAPGARPLAQLSYSWQVAGGGTGTKTVALTDPAAPLLEDDFPGPSLPPAQQATVTVSQMVWLDTSSTASPPAEPKSVTAFDPRPPAAPAVPDALLYTARPDALGRAVLDMTWTASAGVPYTVYYTDENRLVAALTQQAAHGSTAAAAALVALDATADKAQRAGVLRDNAAMFGADLFERLVHGSTAEVEVTGSTGRLRHTLSGSLDVLSCYRVAGEGPSGARPRMNDLDLVVVAVPNVDPPPRPTLAVEFDRASTAATVSVTCGPARTRPVRFQLARTSTDTSEFEQMIRVAVDDDAMTATETGFAGQHADDGAVEVSSSARLKPWRRYTWVARIQGADLPGSTISGRWSEPSEPVSLLVVPPGPPAAATSLSVAGIAGPDGLMRSVVLMFEHPEDLVTLGSRPHLARVTRRRPDSDPEPLGDLPIRGEGPFEVDAFVAGAPDGDPVDGGTAFDLAIVDPLGALGPSSTAVS